VIANLVGMALNKSMLAEHVTLSEDTLQRSSRLAVNNNRDTENYVPLIDENTIGDSDDWEVAFQQHVDRMSTFHHSHE